VVEQRARGNGRQNAARYAPEIQGLNAYDFLKGKNITAKFMLVPRKVSTSCGTCVSFSAGVEIDFGADFTSYGTETVYIEKESGYSKI